MREIDKINDLIVMFASKYKFPKDLRIKYEFVDNVSESAEKYIKSLGKSYDYISEIDYNGATCVPNTTKEETMIFLSKEKASKAEENNCEIICTLFHEITHAIDYFNYYNKYCDGNYNSGINKDSQYGFFNWTEFNAKKISYIEYCKLVHGEKYGTKEHLDSIITNEIPLKNAEIDDDLTSDKYLESIIYNVMFYLGRYSAWEELFSKEFSEGHHFSKELKKYEPLINELYKLLKNCDNTKEWYEDIKKYINYFKGMYVNISSELKDEN